MTRHRDYLGRTYMQAWADEWRDANPPTPAWENTWWGILIQVVVLATLMFGIPFLLWVLTAPTTK